MIGDGSVFLIGITVGFFLGGVAIGSTMILDYKNQAIERGYGLYCPDTGYFAWKDECQKK